MAPVNTPTQRLLPLLLLLAACAAQGGSREQAQRIHDRLTGVPADAATLDAMAALISDGNATAAAELAMTDDAFYDVTLRRMAAPWTNREQNLFVPLNDYIATVVGMVRDNRDFRELLYGDYLYVADASGLPAYSVSDNRHYEEVEARGLSLQQVLTPRPQTSLNGLPAEAVAGVITSRAAAQSFFIAGTNRAMFRFTLMSQLCRDLEQVSDTTRTPDRIRQDVSRSPGGDSRVFLNNCIGCHAGMDPLAQAFAYYNFSYDRDNDPLGANGRLTYNAAGQLDAATGSRVVAKYHINSNSFAPGYITPDDRWDNYWRAGRGSLLGWDPALPGHGNGARSMGQELAHSEAFAQCQVEKVFNNVCLRDPVNSGDRSAISAMVANFAANGFSLKTVFADAAVHCMGD